MPALTHGRVINGFNQYSRSITYARPNCPPAPVPHDKCGGQKPFCCGNPLQPFKISPGTYCGSGFCRIPTGNGSRKQAAATGVIGRSTIAKRAIYRRVANCQGSVTTPTTKEGAKTTCCCSTNSGIKACVYCVPYRRSSTPLQSFVTPVQITNKSRVQRFNNLVIL